MIEAISTKPGWLAVEDAQGRRHVVSAFAMSKPQAAGLGTTYLKLAGYQDVFVRCTVDEAQAAARRARTLRKAEVAAAQRAPFQLCLAFGEKEEAGALTPAPRLDLSPRLESDGSSDRS